MDPSQGGRLSEQSFKPSIFRILTKIFFVHRAGERPIFRLAHFGFFSHLLFETCATYLKTRTKYHFSVVNGPVNLVAELRIGFDSLLTDQEMNKEWTKQYEMRKLQVFHLFIGRPPTTHEFGVRSLPGGRGPGGKGDFLLEVFEGQNSQQETRRYPVNTLNQYSNVILSQK